MTHASIMIVFNEKPDNIQDMVDEAMFPFDENLSKEFEKKIPADGLKEAFEKWKKENPEHQEEYKYNNPSEWLAKWNGYKLNEEKTHYGYHHNPDAKWDWYEIGGRWQGDLINKKGNKCDYGLVGEIDWEATRKAGELTEESFTKNDRGFYKPEYIKKLIKNSVHWITYAVLWRNKKWHEKSEMWWWGIETSSDNSCKKDGVKMEDINEWSSKYKERFLDKLEPNNFVVMVDYHI